MVSIYARQSIEKVDSLSIDAQIEKCIQLCNYKGWDYEVYKDAGFSGSNIIRPAFESLINDLKANKIDKIVTYRLDRISRNINDFGALLKLFDEHKVDFISVTENFDTSTPMGRAMIYIIMVFAQLERETTAERIKDNAMHRASLGRFTGGPVPFGYNKIRITENNQNKPLLVINESESEIVQMFYDWYLESGGSIRGNVIRANNSGIKTKQNLAWNSNQMSRILQNVLYCKNQDIVYDYFSDSGINMINSKDEFDGSMSCMYFRKRKKHKKTTRVRDISEQYIIIAEHEGIIDSERWIAVQQKLSLNKSKPPRLGDSENSILTGLVRCEICNSSMAIYYSSSKKYRYFKCRKKESQGKIICSSANIRAEKLEENVLDYIFKNFDEKKYLKDFEKQIKQKNKNEKLLKEKINIQKKITEISNQIENIIDNVSTKKDSNIFSLFEKKIINLEKEKQELLKHLKEIENKINFENNDINNAKYFLDSMSFFKENFKKSDDYSMQKQLINSIIKEIHVKNGEITEIIFWT